MPFVAALSEHPVPAVAVGAAVGDVVERLGSAPDVAVLFVTPHHVGALEDIAAAVQTLLDPTAFIGVTAVAVLAGDRGVEEGPGLALWAGRLAGSVTPVHLTDTPCSRARHTGEASSTTSTTVDDRAAAEVERVG